MGFSSEFLWGAASAAYQIEGAHCEEGKGPGIWDALAAHYVKHGDNGDMACDHYHRYREDVALMKKMGLKAYRFSVSWPRIMPREHEINEKGIRFYKNLVKELENAGITPICTLYHWNLPMWLHEKGGWFCDEISNYFAEFAKAVTEALSDKVAFWITFNEAATFIGNGYITGGHAPFEVRPAKEVKTLKEVCILTKNVLLAHGKAVRMIRKKAVLAPQIGIAMDGTLLVPWKETEGEIEKARQAMFADEIDIRQVSWWLNPVLKNEIHPALEEVLGEEEREWICQPLDFLGYNCYKANNYDDEGGKNEAVYPGMPRTAMGWAITPDALYWAVRFLQETYHLPILITENGMANTDFKMNDGRVHDPQRIEYLRWYLKGLKRAVDEGYQVLGYLYWSVLDNFEWAEGYDKRFGLIYVDYRTQERILKDSALWYARLIKENGENL